MARLALLTKASIRPYFRSIIVSMLIIGFIRHVCLMKRPAVDVAVAWPLASSMSETIMIAPSRAVRSTIAEPMPIALPVISATFPSHAVPWLFFSQAAFRDKSTRLLERRTTIGRPVSNTGKFARRADGKALFIERQERTWFPEMLRYRPGHSPYPSRTV